MGKQKLRLEPPARNHQTMHSHLCDTDRTFSPGTTAMPALFQRGGVYWFLFSSPASLLPWGGASWGLPWPHRRDWGSFY